MSNLVIAICEYALGMLIFHRALPAALSDCHWRAWRRWLLGMALVLFATGRLSDWINGVANAGIYTFGHACLIVFSTLQYRQTVQRWNPSWFEFGPAEPRPVALREWPGFLRRWMLRALVWRGGEPKEPVPGSLNNLADRLNNGEGEDSHD
jgi:hypothetical protein